MNSKVKNIKKVVNLDNLAEIGGEDFDIKWVSNDGCQVGIKYCNGSVGVVTYKPERHEWRFSSGPCETGAYSHACGYYN
jgi:hypothetical protein